MNCGVIGNTKKRCLDISRHGLTVWQLICNQQVGGSIPTTLQYINMELIVDFTGMCQVRLLKVSKPSIVYECRFIWRLYREPRHEKIKINEN